MSRLPALRSLPVGRATIGDALRRQALHTPDKVFLRCYSDDGGFVEQTFAQFNARVNRFAQAAIAHGLKRGDVVALMTPGTLDCLTALFGSLRCGAAVTGVNPASTDTELVRQLRHCEAGWVVAEEPSAERVTTVVQRNEAPGVRTVVTSGDVAAPAPLSMADLVGDRWPDDEPEAEVDELDTALLVYTSGTEAAPKGVVIPHRNYVMTTAKSWADAVGVQADDTWLFVMPFHTISGLGTVISLMMRGTRVVLPRSIKADIALRLVVQERVTAMAQTPTFYLALARHDSSAGVALRSLKRCVTYGGRLPLDVVDAWAAAGCSIEWVTYWGQSELTQLGVTGRFRTSADVPGADPSWIGRPVTDLETKILDAESVSNSGSQVGELLCRTPAVMDGYFRAPEATAAVLRDDWVHTGDVVRRDTDGELFFHDRTKDMIKSGGMNVASAEVEVAVESHPSVQQCAVVAVPDKYWSEAVAAFVVFRPAAHVTEADLIAHTRGLLASYKVPKLWRFVDSIPVDPQGKILKRELRAVVQREDGHG